MLLKKCPLFAMLFLLACSSHGQLKPFISDGCSVFPDGTIKQNDLWLDCCVAHDFAYWKGGTFEARKAADEELKACVAALGEPTIAKIMKAGVRLGGTPFVPSSFRWGYGWSFPRGYGELSTEEQKLIESTLQKQNPDIIKPAVSQPHSEH